MSALCSSRLHQIPDALWVRLDLLIPVYAESPKGGRPRLRMRNVVVGIFYVLATGCQWKAMPKQFGSGSAIHTYFQEWTKLVCGGDEWGVWRGEYRYRRGLIN